MTEEHYDVVIVGGGPAGLSAALVLSRARRNVLVVDDARPRNRFATHMHGVLGHDRTPPRDLLESGRAEVADYGGRLMTARVVTVVRRGGGLAVELSTGDAVTTRTLLVTTGLVDHLPEIPGLAELWGTGVVVCPYCDGYEARDSRVGVLVTSSAGIAEAQLVRQWSDDVTMFAHDLGEIAPDDAVGLEARGITCESRGVTRVLAANGRLSGVELDDASVIPLDTLFVTPELQARSELLSRLSAEFIDTGAGSFVKVSSAGKTSVDFVWAAGNVTHPGALIPMVSGAAVAAALAINSELVDDDIRRAVERSREHVPDLVRSTP